MQPLAEPVIAAVRRGEIQLHPERWTRTFYRWMEGIQDWCISRQVLWGHAIPVYYCQKCGATTVAVEPPTACGSCGGSELRSDPDVLDAWFTSWMWPFASMGWPELDPGLTGYYPTRVLVTGRDIMFFWVARMMMAGYQFTSERPFSDVYFTGMLRDEQGRRMSKHLGNSPDPLVVIRERGADTLRFSLLFPNPTAEDGPFGPSALDGARNFLTKLWNLVRFSLPHVPPGTPPPTGPPMLEPSAALENRWILARYARTVDEVDRGYRDYEFTRAATALHTFVWHDLADRYVEIAKESLAGARGEPARRESQAVLLFVIERTLRLLHPFVPHVTEELWHALPHPEGLLDHAAWPTAAEAPVDAAAETEIAPVLDAAHLLRNLRSDERVAPSATPRAWIRPSHAEARATLSAHRAIVVRLAGVSDLELLEVRDPAPTGAAGRVASFGECFLERPPTSAGSSETLERERAKLEELLTKARNRLSDPGFRGRAPPAVVAETEAKASELATRIARLDEHLKEAASSAGSK